MRNTINVDVLGFLVFECYCEFKYTILVSFYRLVLDIDGKAYKLLFNVFFLKIV